MPELDDEVKTWFFEMCQAFREAKMVVSDTGAKESVRIDLPQHLQSQFKTTKQFATIQYMGGSTRKPKYYDNIEIRFYAEVLDALSVTSIVESRKSMQHKEWNGPNPYYRYNIIDDYDFIRYVKPILVEIKAVLSEGMGGIFDNLPEPGVPLSIKELPRYVR